jgi:hypothetical protein
VEKQHTEAETALVRSNLEGAKPSKIDRIRRFQFRKGKGANRDPRIRGGGRPRSFTEFRKLVQRIISETVEVKEWPNGNKKITRMTAAEAIVRHWCRSKDPAMHRLLAEYGFGKVPDRLEASGLEGRTTLVLHYSHERPALEAPDAPAVNGEGTRKPLLTDG